MIAEAGATGFPSRDIVRRPATQRAVVIWRQSGRP
jgi:hypothetical protein